MTAPPGPASDMRCALNLFGGCRLGAAGAALAALGCSA